MRVQGIPPILRSRQSLTCFDRLPEKQKRDCRRGKRQNDSRAQLAAKLLRLLFLNILHDSYRRAASCHLLFSGSRRTAEHHGKRLRALRRQTFFSRRYQCRGIRFRRAAGAAQPLRPFENLRYRRAKRGGLFHGKPAKCKKRFSLTKAAAFPETDTDRRNNSRRRHQNHSQ